MIGRIEREVSWPLLALAASSLLGAGLGIAAIPSALPALAALTVAQLAVTALGLLARRRPVLWAFAVAAVSLSAVILDPRLSELAYSGAIPWISLGTAVAAVNLYRRAADWTAIWAGTGGLVLGSASLVVVCIDAGVPATSAVLAAGVPFLVGVVIALMLHLGDAREDRVRRSALADAIGDRSDRRSLAPDALDVSRRALTIVALRSDELVSTTGDESTRLAAADLRDVARRALTDPGAGDAGIVRIELQPVGEGDDAQSPSRPPMPDLPDREREILRLVATGATNAAIGRSLYLSEATVKQYVSRLMRKFDRDNRTQLAIMAARWFDGEGA